MTETPSYLVDLERQLAQAEYRDWRRRMLRFARCGLFVGGLGQFAIAGLSLVKHTPFPVANVMLGPWLIGMGVLYPRYLRWVQSYP